jgi:hypothetical protein
MEMLEYENISAKLSSVTPLSEKHGNKRVPAQSLIIEVVLSNRRLAVWDDGLRFAFYRVPDGTEVKPSLGLDPDDMEGLTEKRFPWFKQDIEIERELSGYTLIIDFGLGDDKSNIELDAKKICDFKIGIRDHGLFALRHRFVVHPTTIEKGRIEEMLQQEIKVTLRAPKADGQGDLLDQPKKGNRGRPKKVVPNPFVQPGGVATDVDDTFANTDIPAAQLADKQAQRQRAHDAGEWPFPHGVPHPDGEQPVEADQDEAE